MNLRYWGKTVIKLLNLINSVYNFSSNGNKFEKSGIKTSMLACEHLSMQGTLPHECVSTQGMLACELVSTQGTLAHEHINMQGTLACEHISMQGTMACRQISTQGTLAREHLFSMQSTLACEHVFRMQGMQFSRLLNKLFNFKFT